MPRTIEDLRQYDLPSLESQHHLRQLGVRDQEDFILTRDVSAHIETAFREVEIFFKPDLISGLTLSRCQSLKKRFIDYIEASLAGNPYPGEHYSVAQARQLVRETENSNWTPETIQEEVRKLKSKFEASLVD